MKENYSKSIIIISAILVIVIVISTLGYLYFSKMSDTMTAMKALEYSTPIAKEWNQESELFYMGVTDYFADPSYYPETEKGRFQAWFCLYAIPTNGENTSSILLKVFSNGTVTEVNRAEDRNLYETYGDYITNWTIDSDEAFDIAVKDDVVSNWLEAHPDAKLVNFFIDHKDYTNWQIAWIDKSDPNSRYIYVSIAADTGEVLFINSI
jgi:hypothetical protein